MIDNNNGLLHYLVTNKNENAWEVGWRLEVVGCERRKIGLIEVVWL